MVVKEISFHSTLYELAKRLREEILRRPHGLALSADDLKGEDKHIHIATIQSGDIVATVIKA